MELRSVRIERSPDDAGRVRLSGEVAYDDRPGDSEQYWFDYPGDYRNSVTDSGNPWLAALLPLAAKLGEPIRLCRPVDPVLRANAGRLMEIWNGWYPELAPVRIEADAQPLRRSDSPKAAALFSGGVDSYFTVLRNAERTDRERFPAIDWLMLVRGFDMHLFEPEEEFARRRSRLALAARDLGKVLVDVVTNLRETRSGKARWGPLAHGCNLASVGLSLERSLGTVYIAATHSTGSEVPWGSHPETDPLLSTASTRVIHDGVDVGRSEKTEYVARSPVAMRSLHVCYRSASSENCGACRKCLLTMMSLELAGALSDCAAFSGRSLDPEKVRRIFVDVPINEVIFRDLGEQARSRGRADIADALDESLLRSRRLRTRLAILRRFESKRGIWRVARKARRALLARAIR